MQSTLSPKQSLLRGCTLPQRHRSIRQRVVQPRAQQSFSSKPKAPEGVTQPPVSPELPPPKFGFVDNAERLNSRACMIGFFALIAVEFIIHRGFLDAIGFKTGNGLPFEI